MRETRLLPQMRVKRRWCAQRMQGQRLTRASGSAAPKPPTAQFTVFYKINKAYQRGLSHTTGLVNSSALQRCLVRLKRSTPGREQRVSLEKSRKKYMAGSVQFRVHRALLVVFVRSVLLPPAFAAEIRMSSHSDAPRSPVVAVWAGFWAKVDEEVWSAHERGSGARVS